MPASHRTRPVVALLLGGALLLALAALFPVAPSRAEVRSLFPRSPAFADIQLGTTITADNRFALFVADLEQDGVRYLYRAPLAGGDPVRLNDPATAGRGVRTFSVSPDGTRVVFIAALEVENRDELYSAPLEGGQPVKLSGALPAGGNVGRFQIHPNSSTVVYWADQEVNDTFELYRVTIDGGTPVKLNPALVAGGDVREGFQISANGQFAVYQADQVANDREELYSVALGNGNVETLNGALAQNGDVDYFRLSPVLNIAVYVANQNGVNEIFSVQLNGNPIGKLNGALPAGKRVTYSEITPDGQRVMYTVGKSFGSAAEGQLFSVSIFGGAALPISPTPGAGGDVGFTRISADSSTAVFSFVPSSGGLPTVYSAPLATGARTTLLSLTADQNLFDLSLSPDSAWLVYGLSEHGSAQILAAPVGGGTVVPLSFSAENAFSPRISPQSDRVVFSSQSGNTPACPDVNSFSVQIFGGGRRQLTDLCGTGTDSLGALFSPDGSRVLYAVSFRDPPDATGGFELLLSDGQALPPTSTPSATPTVTTTPAPGPQRVALPLVRR